MEHIRWDILNMRELRIYVAFLFSFFLLGSASGIKEVYPKAENITWFSNDFKTLLTWDPKPTNYTYTVEFSRLGKDRERNPHCIKTTNTECDLTNMLKDLNATYTADVISEDQRGVNSDLIEFPYARSGQFCPYKDTNIGSPDFSIKVNQDKSKITLLIQDPVSAIYQDNRLLNMRDIFRNDLQYKVIYRKAMSTGKKEKFTNINTVELDVDKGVSYCFNVQAYIPSRRADKQLGKISSTKCSPDDNKSIFEEYSLGVIVGGIFTVLTALAMVIALIVVCCRRSKRPKDAGKEGVPLRSV